MSDTPETDAFQQTDQCAYDSMWRGFARKLERRLAEYAEDKARLSEMVLDAKSERDLWKAEAERWREINK
jgi:hypothetical protein